MLIAVCHVLHRLLPPRHPPDALWHLIALKNPYVVENTPLMVLSVRQCLVVSRFALRNQHLNWCRTNPSSRCKNIATDCRSELLIFYESSFTWWSQTESNRRPLECKSSALPTELWPRSGKRRRPWWAEEDLNLRPHAYQACALTT